MLTYWTKSSNPFEINMAMRHRDCRQLPECSLQFDKLKGVFWSSGPPPIRWNLIVKAWAGQWSKKEETVQETLVALVRLSLVKADEVFFMFQGGGYLPYQSMPKRARPDGPTNSQWGNSGFQSLGSSNPTYGSSSFQSLGSSNPTYGSSSFQSLGSSNPTYGSSSFQSLGSSNPMYGSSSFQSLGSSNPTYGSSSFQSLGSSNRMYESSSFQSLGSSNPKLGNSGFQGQGLGRSDLPYRVGENRRSTVRDVPYKDMHSQQPQTTAKAAESSLGTIRESIQSRIEESQALIHSLTKLKDIYDEANGAAKAVGMPFDQGDTSLGNSGFNTGRDTQRHTARQGTYREVEDPQWGQGDRGWGQSDQGWGQSDQGWGRREQQSEERVPWKEGSDRSQFDRINSRSRMGESRWNEGDSGWNRGDQRWQGGERQSVGRDSSWDRGTSGSRGTPGFTDDGGSLKGQRFGFGTGTGFQLTGFRSGRFSGSNFGSRDQGAYGPSQVLGRQGPAKFGGPRGRQEPSGPKAASSAVQGIGQLMIKEGPPGNHMGPTKSVWPSDFEKQNSPRVKVPFKIAFKNMTQRLRSFGARGSITAAEFEAIVHEEDVGLWTGLVMKREKNHNDGVWEHICDLYIKNVYISTARERGRAAVRNAIYNEALKVFLSKAPDAIIRENPKRDFTEMTKKADSVETPYMTYDCNYSNVMIKRENDDPLPISDFIVLEPEHSTPELGTSATSILRQSADFSKVVLSFETKPGPTDGWICTIGMENQVIGETFGTTRLNAKRSASQVVLQKLQRTNYTFLLKKNGRKMVPVVQDIIAEFGHPALDTEEAQQEYQDTLCVSFKHHFGECGLPELAIPMKNMTPTEKFNIVAAAKTFMLNTEVRVQIGNDDEGRPLYQKLAKGDNLETDNQFLVVSRRPQGQDVLKLLQKYGENSHYKLKYPSNMEQTEKYKKPKEGLEMDKTQEDGEDESEGIHEEGDDEGEENSEGEYDMEN